MMNARVLHFIASQKMGFIRILTDRVTEYCGKLEIHNYELYLGVNDIEHTRDKARQPQTIGIRVRLHLTTYMSFTCLRSDVN